MEQSLRALARELSKETGWTFDRVRMQLRRGRDAQWVREDAADHKESHTPAPIKQQWVVAQKAKPCLDCGQHFPPECMDFHHRDPRTKAFNVAAYRVHSLEALRYEAEKCDVICANCHRIRHASGNLLGK